MSKERQLSVGSDEEHAGILGQRTAEYGIRSIAFLVISTGAYPLKAATEIAVGTVREWVSQRPVFDDVVSGCYSGEDFATYKKVLGRPC